MRLKHPTVTAPVDVVFDPDLGAHDVRVYLAVSHLVTNVGHDRASQSVIGTLAKVGPKTVYRSLHRLAAAGHVTVDRSAAPHAYTIPASSPR